MRTLPYLLVAIFSAQDHDITQIILPSGYMKRTQEGKFNQAEDAPPELTHSLGQLIAHAEDEHAAKKEGIHSKQ